MDEDSRGYPTGLNGIILQNCRCMVTVDTMKFDNIHNVRRHACLCRQVY